jgi:hypothetical protein
MKTLIRVTLMALNLAVGIPAAHATTASDTSTPAQQDNAANWFNG